LYIRQQETTDRLEATHSLSHTHTHTHAHQQNKMLPWVKGQNTNKLNRLETIADLFKLYTIKIKYKLVW